MKTATQFCRQGWLAALLAIFIVVPTVAGQTVTKSTTTGAATPMAATTALLEKAQRLRDAQPELFAGSTGVLVTETVPDTQAETSDIRPGDILLRYAGQVLNSPQHLVELTAQVAPETSVTVDLIRDGRRWETTLHGGRIGVAILNLAVTPEDLLIDELAGLYEQGQKSLANGDYRAALATFETGLTKARVASLLPAQGMFFAAIGFSHYVLEQYNQAQEPFEQALAIHLELGEPAAQARDRNNLGDLYRQLGLYSKALEQQRQSRALYQGISDHRGEAIVLQSMANIYIETGQPETALDHFRRAREVFHRLGDQIGEKASLIGIALAYNRLEMAPQAEYYQQLAGQLAAPGRSATLESEPSLSLNDFYRQFTAAMGAGHADELLRLTAFHPDLIAQLRGNWSRRAIEDPQNRKMWEEAVQFLDDSKGMLVDQGAFRDGRDGQLALLYVTGTTAEKDGDYPTALERWQRGLALAGERKDRAQVAKFLAVLSLFFEHRGQYPTALEYGEKAFSEFQALDDKEQQAGTLQQIGNLNDGLGRHGDALQRHQQALVLHRALGLRRGEGADLFNIGNAYSHQQRHAEALESYKQALVIAQDHQDTGTQAAILDQIGTIHTQQGQYAKALTLFEQAQAINQRTHDQHAQGVTLNNLGSLYATRGQYSEALESFQQALAIARSLGSPKEEAAILANIGAIHQKSGQYVQALVALQQALTLSRQLELQGQEGIVLGNIGVLYLSMGMTSEALGAQEKTLAIAKALGDRQLMTDTLNNLGAVHKHLGQYQQAIEYLQDALERVRAAPPTMETASKAIILGNLGAVAADMGQYDQALKYDNEALTIAVADQNRLEQSRNLTNLGEVHRLQGQDAKALGYLRQALAILEEIDHPERLWQTQWYTALSSVGIGDDSAALKYYEQALATIERLRAGLEREPTDPGTGFARGKLPVYDGFMALLARLHQNHPDQGHDRRAFEVFERRQGRAFLEQMGNSGALRFAGIPDALLQEERALPARIDSLRKGLARQWAKPVDRAALERGKEKQSELAELEAQEQALQTRIQRDYPTYYALKHPRPATLAELRKQVLRPGETLLAYAVLERQTLLWLVSRKGLALFTLPVGAKALQAKVDDLRIALGLGADTRGVGQADPELPSTSASRLSHALYRRLLPPPVRDALAGSERLFVVPTGPLYALPFELLISETRAEYDHYLVEDYPIAYLSSASLLKVLRDSAAHRRQTPAYPFLAFANPVYTDRNPSQGPNIPQGETAMVRDLRTRAFLALRGGDFRPLPETEQEARAIARLLRAPQESQPLQLGEMASKATLFELNNKGRLDDYHYLLFATHGLLPGQVDHLTQPALVLSHPRQEGYLTMADVFQLRLNAGLVSLSACNTGRGESIAGEGIMGLTRAFMYAGTPAVAVTLWSVASRSATQLSIELFRQLQSVGSVAEALRAAKLSLLRGEKGERFRAPYHWAPYVLFGDGWDTHAQLPR